MAWTTHNQSGKRGTRIRTRPARLVPVATPCPLSSVVNVIVHLSFLFHNGLAGTPARAIKHGRREPDRLPLRATDEAFGGYRSPCLQPSAEPQSTGLQVGLTCGAITRPCASR